METRQGRIIVSRAGGTAGKGAKTYKLSLPSAWIQALGLTEDRSVTLSFDEESITILPQQNLETYKKMRLSQHHDLLSLRFYNGNQLCTLIYADRTSKDLQAENYTDQLVKTAFGKNDHPTWDDFQAFLEERCIPKQRSGIREYLEALGMNEYDPLSIIGKTQGRMAEDDQWLEVEHL